MELNRLNPVDVNLKIQRQKLFKIKPEIKTSQPTSTTDNISELWDNFTNQSNISLILVKLESLKETGDRGENKKYLKNKWLQFFQEYNKLTDYKVNKPKKKKYEVLKTTPKHIIIF